MNTAKKIKFLSVLEGKTCLFLAESGDGPEALMKFLGSYGLKFRMLALTSELRRSDFANVDFALIRSRSEPRQLASWVADCRRVGKDAPVYVITTAAQRDHHDAFYQGAECIFDLETDFNTLLTEISASLNELEEARLRKHGRRTFTRVRAEIETSLGKIDGYAKNISRGGVFVGTAGLLPSLNEKVRVLLKFEGSQTPIITGKAIVRWRRDEIQGGKPKGFGLEFID